MRGFWTPARVSILKERWAEGDTASMIGERLGCSRNAVIGKVNRLGLICLTLSWVEKCTRANREGVTT